MIVKGVSTLHAEPAPGCLRYRLEVPERDLVEPLQEEFRQPIDEPTLRALRDSTATLLRSPERPGFAAEAQRRGAVLYRALIPPGLRAPLKAIRGPLLVSTSLYGLPWELLYDDEEFWGLRYAMGKRLVMNRPLVASGHPSVPTHPRALVIGSDPRSDLPFVAHEVEVLCDALEELADIVCVTGHMATFDTVTAHLGGRFDLIHYCGHVVTGPEGPALLLADEVPLSAGVIEATLAGRPLVVLNGCASARGAAAGAGGQWEEGFASVAYGFLFGGAVGVVGSLSDVSDEHAAVLAEEFYRRVLAPVPVGEALRAARQHCRVDPASADSPSWLAFVLYGNPAQMLPGIRPAEAPQPVREAQAPTSGGPWRVRARYMWAAVVLLVLLVAGMRHHNAGRGPLVVAKHEGPLIVGVMEVRPRSPTVPDWMREITRDSLNTILSKLDGIQVYSRQKIDFVREKRHLSEIEAAETLGMTKMLSATLAVEDSRVTLALQVVDIGSGLLEGSDSVQGSPDRLIELQNQLAMRALAVLGITPSAEKMKEILASRTNDTLEGYRMLTETLGGMPAGSAPPVPTPAPGTSWLTWGAMAWAEEPSSDETAIRSLLARWVSALEAKDIEALAGLQAGMSEPQRAAVVRYFDNAQHLEVRLSNIEVLIEGDEALATFTREDRFTDGRSGRPIHLEVRMSSMLGRDEDGWKIRGLRSPS